MKTWSMGEWKYKDMEYGRMEKLTQRHQHNGVLQNPGPVPIPWIVDPPDD